MSTMGLIFKLLHEFAASRNSQAPVIYKLLTFALVENIEDEDVREFMLDQFARVFAVHKTIPVSILAEPFIRVLQLTEKKVALNVFDFAFFKMLASHPKLTPTPLGLQMMDQLAKVVLSDQVWASSANVSLMILGERFKDE